MMLRSLETIRGKSENNEECLVCRREDLGDLRYLSLLLVKNEIYNIYLHGCIYL